MRKRNHQIIVRLDDEELLMLKRKIHRSDLTMAEYFRLLIENGEIKMIGQDVQQDMTAGSCRGNRCEYQSNGAACAHLRQR